jgi:hypothetical protein
MKAELLYERTSAADLGRAWVSYFYGHWLAGRWLVYHRRVDLESGELAPWGTLVHRFRTKGGAERVARRYRMVAA